MNRTLGFVLPVHNEGAGLVAFHTELARVMAVRSDLDCAFVYIDDGSTDGSAAILATLALTDPRVRVITLSRNFGHQRAITAGLDVVPGDAVVIMDTDLQDPPADALRLIEAWERGDGDLVHARRLVRNESWFKRRSASAYYCLLARVADVPIPRNVGDFRLADRRVVDQVLRFTEHDRYLRGIFAWVGFRPAFVDYDRPARTSDASSYSLARMLRLAADGLWSFSAAPLKLVRWVGLFLLLLALGGAGWLGIDAVIGPQRPVANWAVVVVSVLFVGGVQILMLAAIGGYVGRIFNETTKRPLYIVASDTGSLRLPPPEPRNPVPRKAQLPSVSASHASTSR